MMQFGLGPNVKNWFCQQLLAFGGTIDKDTDLLTYAPQILDLFAKCPSSLRPDDVTLSGMICNFWSQYLCNKKRIFLERAQTAICICPPGTFVDWEQLLQTCFADFTSVRSTYTVMESYPNAACNKQKRNKETAQRIALLIQLPTNQENM